MEDGRAGREGKGERGKRQGRGRWKGRKKYPPNENPGYGLDMDYIIILSMLYEA